MTHLNLISPMHNYMYMYLYHVYIEIYFVLKYSDEMDKYFSATRPKMLCLTVK